MDKIIQLSESDAWDVSIALNATIATLKRLRKDFPSDQVTYTKMIERHERSLRNITAQLVGWHP